MKTCSICGRQYSAPPATSRVDGSDICPVCGSMESLAGFPDEMKAEVIRKIEEQEIAWGRVEKRDEALA